MSKKKQFPFVYVSGKLTHRSGKGSKARYRLDKLCRDLTIQDLSIILERWDKRAKSETNQQRRRELKACCKIIRDWRNLKKNHRWISSRCLLGCGRRSCYWRRHIYI